MHSETALLRAAWKGNAASVSLLLRHGASVQLCNKAGHTPLIIASLHGNYGTVKALLTFSTSKGPKSTDAAESSGPNSDPGIDNGSGGTLVRRTGLTHASANGEGRPPVLPSDIGQQDIATNNRTQAQPPSAAPSTPSSSTLRLRRSLTPSVTATGPGHVHNADNANTEAGGQTGSATESKMNSSTCTASNKSTEHGRGGGAADADNDDGISGSMNRNMSVCNTDTSQEPREVTPADDDGESDLANEEDASGHQHRESQSDGKTHASSQQGGNQTGMENQNPVRCHSGGINVNGEEGRRGVRERGEGWEAKMAGAMEGLGDGLGGGGRAVRAEGCDVEAGSQQEEQMVAVTSDLLNVRDNEGKTAIMYLALRSPQNIYWEGVTLCLHRGAIVRGGLGKIS